MRIWGRGKKEGEGEGEAFFFKGEGWEGDRRDRGNEDMHGEENE